MILSLLKSDQRTVFLNKCCVVIPKNREADLKNKFPEVFI